MPFRQAWPGCLSERLERTRRAPDRKTVRRDPCQWRPELGWRQPRRESGQSKGQFDWSPRKRAWPANIRRADARTSLSPPRATNCTGQPVSFPGEFLAVIVGRVAIHRVNVHRDITTQPLRGVLDDHRRSLDSKVALAGFQGSAPGKPGVREVGLDLVYLLGGCRFMNDSRPFCDEFQQQLALAFVERGGFQ